MRLAWLTGFTGSAGTAIVLRDEAAIFVDGRYTLQAATEVDTAAFAIAHLVESPPSKWLGARVKAGDRIGFDPWLLTVAEARRYRDACAAAGAELVALPDNPIDAIWTDRPAPPLGAVREQPEKYAGESAASKLERLRAILTEKKVDGAVLTLTDSIAWTFNIRGADIPHNPVVLADALLRREGKAALFVDGRKLSNEVRATLDDGGRYRRAVAICTRARLAQGPAHPARSEQRPRRDPRDPGERRRHDRRGRRSRHRSEIAEECRRTRRCPPRPYSRRRGDGALPLLARPRGATGKVDEIGAAEALERFRIETAAKDGTPLEDISFDTISGAGPNGAIVHYRVTRATNRRLEPGSLYLVDSGGQYRDGTTDITRTVAVGEANRRDARPLHARAEGPHRRRHRTLPGGHDRHASRLIRAPSALGRRPRLRSRHGPRRRLVSLGA